MKKTKIICSIGPVSRKYDVMKSMIENGMNVARINFSHADDTEKKETVELVRKLNKELKDGSIMIGLIDNKLHIAIETNKETFLDKYQSGTSETKQEEYKYFLRKYKLITTIVDILNKK